MQKSYQPDLKVEPTKQMRHQMEKKRKKEQERRKMFKAERMQQDKMSHVSIFHCSHMHHIFVISRRPAFIRVVMVSTREVEEEAGSVQ